jgi:hypothetical protein
MNIEQKIEFGAKLLLWAEKMIGKSRTSILLIIKNQINGFALVNTIRMAIIFA